MKQTDAHTQNSFLAPVKKGISKALVLFPLLAGALSGQLSAQTTYTFTNAGATGNTGPTQAQVNTAYASTSLSGSITVGPTQGIQQFTVPVTGGYRILAKGAQGYGTFGGRGAAISGDFTLTAGTVLRILVGQKSELNSNVSYNTQYGGGGGSFVTSTGNVPYVVAGGGGGSWATSFTSNTDASTLTAGNPGGGVGTSTGVAGTGGGGGGTNLSADGGGGITGNGGGTAFGYAFVNGGNGGFSTYGIGGFGGGAGTASFNYRRGAGGGGYSGGGGAYFPDEFSGAPEGGGGGSYNSGVNQVNTAGANTGQGSVVISFLCNVNVATTSSLICAGSSVTLTTNAVSNYSWSTGNNTSSVVVVSPNTTTTYTVSGTGSNPVGCSGSAVVTVTVNNTPTITVVSSTNSACYGQSVTLTASGANTYTWTGGVTNAVSFTPSATSGYTVTGTNACGTASAATTISVSVLPVFVSATSTLICSGSAATLSAGGATTYTWMPGANSSTNYVVNPTANTTYTVTGKTGSCLGTNTIAISTKPNPTISIVATSTVICEGDATSLTASGALTYTWNPGGSNNISITVSPTVATLYTATGINSVNCTSSTSQVILVRPKPVVTATASDDLVCVGGASTLTASGANTYLWSNNAGTTVTVVNPTQTTTYSVTGTSTAGCVSGTVVTVSVFDPTLTVSSATAICRGTAVNLSAGGMDSYLWSTGSNFSSISVTPTTTTTYSVEGSSTQGIVTCTAHASVLVTVNQNPTLTATSSPTDICKGQSAVLTAGGASSYTWAVPALSTGASLTVTPAADQTYTVAGEDANGCKGSKTVAVKVSGCVGIATNALNTANLVIYPNPSAGDFTISSDQNIDLRIVNELGQQVKTISLNANNKEVKVSNLASGIYFISGENANGSVKQKIVIAK